ncbi:MAG: hypothetical protein F4X03_12950 [Dehalococcoidia bacterium]|nr:hypothetical protein [Dehalococcoidia bacterium]MYD29798.1 hypothetical protein [Dehalococcoidia bacterium]
MRYDPNKAYLYPVLRPGSTDYPRAEFQAEPDPERIEHTTAVRISAEFNLSDPDLLRLIEEGAAQYVLLVRAAATHHRSSHHSSEPAVEVPFESGRLSGRTEIRGLLVAVRDMPEFRAEGWHGDYAGMTFDLHAGDVLAEDEPREYFIDNAEEAPVGSIFQVQPHAPLLDGTWNCDLAGDRVALRMSEGDYRRFMDARSRVNGSPDAMYVMNAVYLPALVHVLQEADHGEEDYGDYRWYRSLDARLAECERPLLGDGRDRLDDAQRLLDQPFAHLPLLAGDA